MTWFYVLRYNVFSVPLVRLPQRGRGERARGEREREVFSSPPHPFAYFSVSLLISTKLARGMGVRLVPFEILLTCSKLRADGIFYLGATPWRKRRRDTNIPKSSEEILYVDVNVAVSQASDVP